MNDDFTVRNIGDEIFIVERKHKRATLIAPDLGGDPTFLTVTNGNRVMAISWRDFEEMVTKNAFLTKDEADYVANEIENCG